ncbi:hypothetical protein HS125_19720 [bacterium]|nr:hypothetical protein [bacterium]
MVGGLAAARRQAGRRQRLVRRHVPLLQRQHRRVLPLRRRLVPALRVQPRQHQMLLDQSSLRPSPDRNQQPRAHRRASGAPGMLFKPGRPRAVPLRSRNRRTQQVRLDLVGPPSCP